MNVMVGMNLRVLAKGPVQYPEVTGLDLIGLIELLIQWSNGAVLDYVQCGPFDNTVGQYIKAQKLATTGGRCPGSFRDEKREPSNNWKNAAMISSCDAMFITALSVV